MDKRAGNVRENPLSVLELVVVVCVVPFAVTVLILRVLKLNFRNDLLPMV